MQVQRYRTSALNLAIFLSAKGYQLIGVETPRDSFVKEFIFEQTPPLEELVGKYRFGDRTDSDLLVPVHLYERARDELLDRMNGH